MINFLNRVKYRVKQFISALSGKLNYSEVTFVQNNLTKEEQILFFAMNVVDQKHALYVAYRCMEDAEEGDWIDKQMIVRAALMHDVGKSYGRVRLMSRIVYVLMNRSGLRRVMLVIAREKSWIKLFRDLYVLLNHGKIGADMLRQIRTIPQVIEVCRKHHEPPEPSELEILPIIRKIDNKL